MSMQTIIHVLLKEIVIKHLVCLILEEKIIKKNLKIFKKIIEINYRTL